MTDSTENPATADAPLPQGQGERIAKLLARSGVASRREVERMIEEGRVTLHGTVVTTPATLVLSPAGIAVDGKPVRSAAPTQIWKLHKPTGVVTTSSDPEGRPTVFSLLPKRLPRVITVGRLDLTTEGLLLLTNDGALARWLELPQNQVARRYRVRVYGVIRDEALDELRRGATIEGVRYGPVEIEVDNANTANAWLTVTLREGKNREIRKIMQYAGLTVNRLIRTDYGPFSLGKLERGMIEPVATDTLHRLLPGFFGAVHEDGDEETGEGSDRHRTEAKAQNRSAWARNKPKANKPNAQKKRISEAAGETPEERRAARPKPRPERVKNRPLRPAQSRPRTKSADERPSRERFADERPREDRNREDRFRGDSARNDRPRNDRPRSEGPRSDRPREDRSRDDRPRSDRPRSEAQRSEGPRGERPRSAGPRNAAPRSDGPRGDRPRQERSRNDRPRDERPRDERPRDERPRGARPAGGKPAPARPSGNRPSGGRPSGNRPSAGRPSGNRPSGGPRGKR